MFQRVGPTAFKKDLTNTLKLCKHLENPENQFRSVHIAGTNGKGSTAHMLASVLQCSGLQVGLYTSPHLKDFRERIKINGVEIDRGYVMDFVENNRDQFELIKPSFFEMTVCLAFKYFADQKVDIAIVETGMGGRLDSTNVLQPLLSVITNISYDHTQYLGNTIEEIAFEKAGIIKEKTPVIIGESQPTSDEVFEKIAQQKNAPLLYADKQYQIEIVSADTDYLIANIYVGDKLRYKDLQIDLTGDYQAKNICTSIQTLEYLRNFDVDISVTHLFEGFRNVKSNTGFNGRWEVLSKDPLTICDIGHNNSGLAEVLKQLGRLNYGRLHFVFGMVNDKEESEILNLLPENAKYYFCKANIPRALDEVQLMKMALKAGLYGESFQSVHEAFVHAQNSADKEDIVFVGGSAFVVAEVLTVTNEILPA